MNGCSSKYGIVAFDPYPSPFHPVHPANIRTSGGGKSSENGVAEEGRPGCGACGQHRRGDGDVVAFYNLSGLDEDI